MTFASGRTTLRLTPTSDQSIGRRQGPGPGAATGLQPRRHPGRRPEAPGRPRPRPPDRHRARHLHRAIGGLTVRCFRNDRRPDGADVRHAWPGRVCGNLWPGRVCGRLPHADDQRGHGWFLRQPPRTWQLVWRAAGHGSGTAATAGHSRVQTRWHGRCPVGMATRPPMREQGGLPQTSPDTSAVTVRRAVQVPDTHGRTTASGVRPAAAVARGTGRRVGGRWWDAASAGGCGRAGRSGGRGAARGQRSSPAG
jgi:hypothetical protein